MAAALKLFSLTPQTKWVYRELSNTLGQGMRIRRGLDSTRIWRAKEILKGILAEFTRDIFRLLKPGGFSIQIIDPGDHLAYYDKHVSQKNCLRYSDKVWRRYFQNNVKTWRVLY